MGRKKGCLCGCQVDVFLYLYLRRSIKKKEEMQPSVLISIVFSLVLAIHLTFSKAQPQTMEDTEVTVGQTIGRVALWSINKLLIPYVNVLAATFFARFIRFITV